MIHNFFNQKYGYKKSLFTTSCTDALEMSAILLDIMLPGKDGIELCKEIRTFSDVPILMVTAKVDEIDRLSNEELHSMSKLLDMIKEIAERCENVYVLCGWSSQYLEQHVVAGQK